MAAINRMLLSSWILRCLFGSGRAGNRPHGAPALTLGLYSFVILPFTSEPSALLEMDLSTYLDLPRSAGHPVANAAEGGVGCVHGGRVERQRIGALGRHDGPPCVEMSDGRSLAGTSLAAETPARRFLWIQRLAPSFLESLVSTWHAKVRAPRLRPNTLRAA